MSNRLYFIYVNTSEKADADVNSRVKPDKPSEFCQDNYDLAILISSYAAIVEDRPLSKRIMDCLDEMCSDGRLYLRYPNRWEKIESLCELDDIYSDEISDINVKEKTSSLKTAVWSFSKELGKERLFVVDEEGRSYLNQFFAISKDVVFSNRNSILLSSHFRRSDFLNGLMSLGAKRIQEKDSPAYYHFSFFSPFAYETINNTLAAMGLLKEDISEKTLLNGLRRSVFFDSVQSAFKRYVYLDNESYRVNLNRHDSDLTAFPVDQLSSTEEIKPIRLFEKTAAFIRSELEKPCGLDRLIINVCIIGHTEPSHCGDESGLMDYASSILNWYAHLGRKKTDFEAKLVKPQLKLNISNLISKGDWPAKNREKERKNFRCSIQSEYWEGDGADPVSHTAECRIEAVDYELEFGFNTRRLKEEIERNDLVFVLDCPWLSAENFEIMQRGSLESFCSELERHQWKNELDRITKHDRFIKEAQGFFKYSSLREIDSQYNRIMASATTRFGTIVRVMRDSMIRRLFNYYNKMRNEKNEIGKSKAMYIFTSEKDGVDYSFLATYPLTRQEKYDGRFHTIIRFDNSLPLALPLAGSAEAVFQINLWSVLKYVSVSFAYLGFKEALKQILGLSGELFDSENSICYMELYRNIVVSFRVDDCLSRVTIRLGFQNGVDDCIDAMKIKSDRDSIKRAILDFAWGLVEPLYGDCVFAENVHYGDEAIKTAFSMNLYSSVRDVETMLFFHRYQTMYQNGDFSSLKVLFDKDDPFVPASSYDDEFKDRDYFGDKKLYDHVMQTLEHSTDFSLGMLSMFQDADRLFEQTYMRDRIIDQIISACESTGYTDTNIYTNARALQRGLSE